MILDAPIGRGKVSRWVIVIMALLFALPTPAHSQGPSRIVSLTPSTTEVLFALGAGPRVVAVTRYCDYPPETARLPKLGGVMDLNLEAVLALRPDLVVAIKTSSEAKALQRLTELGIRVLVVPSDSLTDFSPAVSAIAAAVGAVERGKEVVDAFDRDLRALKNASAKEKPLRTLILVDARPLVAAGRGSFIDGAVANIGLVNVVAEGPFPEIGREEMLRKNPELILDFSEGGATAVAGARLVRLKDPRLLRLTPRLPQALTDLARLVRLP